MHKEASKLKWYALGAGLGMNRIIAAVGMFPSQEIASRLPLYEQNLMKLDWNRYEYWLEAADEINNLITELKDMHSNQRFKFPANTKGIIYTPVGVPQTPENKYVSPIKFFQQSHLTYFFINIFATKFFPFSSEVQILELLQVGINGLILFLSNEQAYLCCHLVQTSIELSFAIRLKLVVY